MAEIFQFKHSGEQIDALLDKAETAVQPREESGKVFVETDGLVTSEDEYYYLPRYAPANDPQHTFAMASDVQATDAKLTELSAKSSATQNIIDAYNLDASIILRYSGYYDIYGRFQSSDFAKNTGIVRIRGFEKIHITNKISELGASLLFYDKDLKMIQSVPGTNQIQNLVIDLSEPQYTNVEYVILSNYNSFDIFKCDLIKDDSINLDIAYLSDYVDEKFAVDESLLFVEMGYYGEGGILNLDGKAQNTGFVKLKGRVNVECQVYMSASAYPIAFFDRYKNFIGGINGLDVPLSKYVAVAPKDAYYVIFSNYGDRPDKYAKVLADSEVSITQKIEDSHIEELPALKNDLYAFAAKLNEQGYIYTKDGRVIGSNYGKVTDFIPLSNFKTLSFKNGGGNADVASVAFYNKDKIFIPSLVVSATASLVGEIDLSLPIYSDAKYVRMTYYNYPTPIFEDFYGILRTAANVVERIENLEKNNSSRLNVLIFGDSITDCCDITIENGVTTQYKFRHPYGSYNKDGKTIYYDKWPYFVKNILKCNEVRNYALSGATYKNQDGGNTRRSLSYQVNLALADLNNTSGAFVENNFVPDIVIFALGTNDGVPNDTANKAFSKIVYSDNDYIDVEGTLANLDNSQFCESAMKSFLTIKKHFPLALCFCVLPLQRGQNDVNLGVLREELTKVANRYGMVIIDGAYDCGIIRDTIMKTTIDGLHPNAEGQNLMARMIISAIKRNYIPFENMNTL